MVITYPLLTVVDDSGVITSGATVTIASVTDKGGSAISSPGATVNQAGPNVSVDYDAEVKGEAWVTLEISKEGSTFTGLNASPAFYLSRDPSRIETNLLSGGGVNATQIGGVAAVAIPSSTGTVTAVTSQTQFTASGLNNAAGAYAPTAKRIRAVLWTECIASPPNNVNETSTIAASPGSGVFTLDQAPTNTITVGDTFIVL